MWHPFSPSGYSLRSEMWLNVMCSWPNDLTQNCHVFVIFRSLNKTIIKNIVYKFSPIKRASGRMIPFRVLQSSFPFLNTWIPNVLFWFNEKFEGIMFCVLWYVFNVSGIKTSLKIITPKLSLRWLQHLTVYILSVPRGRGPSVNKPAFSFPSSDI